jgi:hypothetical protein
VAFAAQEADLFSICLTDAPHVHIEVAGKDVSLFDMSGGYLAESRSFASTPGHWQDFAQKHQAVVLGGEGESAMRTAACAEGAVMEFQECALLVGAVATFVGELVREAKGKLMLQPLQRFETFEKKQARFKKVLVSDDPPLLCAWERLREGGEDPGHDGSTE